MLKQRVGIEIGVLVVQRTKPAARVSVAQRAPMELILISCAVFAFTFNLEIARPRVVCCRSWDASALETRESFPLVIARDNHETVFL